MRQISLLLIVVLLIPFLGSAIIIEPNGFFKPVRASGSGDGLVTYWKFDEGSGTTAHDSSGYGNDGNITEPEWVPGITGSALRFRSSSSFMRANFPYGLGGNHEFTVSFWLKIKTWPTDQYSYIMYFGKADPWDYDKGFHVLLDNDPGGGAPTGTVRANFAFRVVPTIHTFTIDVWYNWAFVYDKTCVKMYQNGTFLENIDLGGATPNLSPDELFFSQTGSPLDGILDYIEIYNYARTAEEIRALHDVIVTNVASSKIVVGQGFNTSINVTMTNQGNLSETFNVTAYANTTIIGSENVTLSAGNFATVTLTWNTTGFAYGNYTTSAYAEPVQDETDIADNNFTGGWIIVSIPGDLTGGTPNPWNFVPDGKVDGKDIAIVALCYGSAPGCPPPYVWNANCDVNNDAKIDGKDIALVALHFGQAGT